MTVRRAEPGENDTPPSSEHLVASCERARGAEACDCALRILDEEIARLRGWSVRAGRWSVTFSPSGDDALAVGLEPGTGPHAAPSAYSLNRHLGMVLLEEIAADGHCLTIEVSEGHARVGFDGHDDQGEGEELPEAAARAWLAWKRTKRNAWDADPEAVTPESIRRTGELLARNDGRSPDVPADSVKREPKAWGAEHFEGYIPPEKEH